MIKAVIFDMDGVLIDSEPMWKQAELDVFSSVGVDVCNKLSHQTASMTTAEVTEFWYRRNPWHGRSLKEVENAVVDQVHHLISGGGRGMPGVLSILGFFNERRIRIGLSTNSPSRLITVVLEKLKIGRYFEAVSSSDQEKRGKPFPDVYLSTAEKLGVDPSQCLAIEDSYSGIVAAKAARMRTVAVLSAQESLDPKYAISDERLKSLSDFTQNHLERLASATTDDK